MWTYLYLAVAMLAVITGAAGLSPAADQVERWDVFEVSFSGPEDGNPFLDVRLTASFRQGARTVEVAGFYDGKGSYRVRFMPDCEGEWNYVTTSNVEQLDGKSGSFTCRRPSPGNHGPVRVSAKTHFAYADGTPFFQVGTTCYCWTHQGDQLEQQTLATLRTAPFNKLRMCVFPLDYAYNKNEPEYYPFPRDESGKNDFARFNPKFFRHLETRIRQLRELGIEADLILFHPYDRWGYATMDSSTDDRYVKYVVARLAAYRNVWWSMANEFDLMKAKSESDWDRLFQLVAASDPYGHLRSIHNCRRWYDHSKPWVTHASIQSSDFGIASELPRRYGKPVIYDECRYEGDVPQGWGNLSAREMTHRFWLGTMSGCFVGHSETYLHPDDILWWTKGGVLHGQSPPRIAFLKEIMTALPVHELKATKLPSGALMLARPGKRYLVYFPNKKTTTLRLDGKGSFQVDGFDTWKMTRRDHGTAHPGPYQFTPPVERYLLRLDSIE